jgi:hypothetical protein
MEITSLELLTTFIIGGIIVVGGNFKMEMAVTDFPHPVSPANPKISPLAI